MTEYYCTNCGSDLESQSGFDPEKETWTCTSCGTHLYGDDVYEGDSYPGVMWYCDDCGELLNKQSGFYDYCSTWTCSNCYHSNIISDDEIINSEDESTGLEDESISSEEGSGNSNAIVDLLETVNSILNTYIDYKSKSKSKGKAEEEYSDIEEDEDIEDIQDEEFNDESLKIVKPDEEMDTINLFIKRAIAFLFRKKVISIRYSSNELIGQNVDRVVNLLKTIGFNNIITKSVKDIYMDSNILVGEVSEVSILDINTFERDYMCKYDERIIITFHEKRELLIPFDLNEYKKLDYKKVLESLVDIGFTNVKTIPLNNIVLGIIKKDKIVSKITIDGISKFHKNEYLIYDTQINIYYNSYI